MLRRPFHSATAGVCPGKTRQAGRLMARAGPADAPSFSKPTLFDIPISNHGARCRFIIYKKGLEGDFDIKSPKELGGLTSESYKALNPLAKMPLLVLPGGTALPESEVIAQYLVAKYKGRGPDMLPAEPELAARVWLISRIHDVYISAVQGCMYKKMDAGERAAKLAELARQLGILEALADGPLLVEGAGGPTTADAAIFPTLCFCRSMLEPIFGWEDIFKSRPKLGAYFAAMQADEAGARVIKEVDDALQGWHTGGRFKDQGILEQVESKDHRWAY